VADTRALIETGVTRFLEEVPALQPLRLPFALELRGRGDVQLYRVEMPGPKITKDLKGDERARLIVPRANFNELAEKGTVKDWHKAFESGAAKAEGPPEILKLIANVVGRQEERDRTRKARH
jgi:hypothetical protein